MYIKILQALLWICLLYTSLRDQIIGKFGSSGYLLVSIHSFYALTNSSHRQSPSEYKIPCLLYTSPGVAIIHAFGGIHEPYFPYILMKPQMILASVSYTHLIRNITQKRS